MARQSLFQERGPRSREAQDEDTDARLARGARRRGRGGPGGALRDPGVQPLQPGHRAFASGRDPGEQPVLEALALGGGLKRVCRLTQPVQGIRLEQQGVRALFGPEARIVAERRRPIRREGQLALSERDACSQPQAFRAGPVQVGRQPASFGPVARFDRQARQAQPEAGVIGGSLQRPGKQDPGLAGAPEALQHAGLAALQARIGRRQHECGVPGFQRILRHARGLEAAGDVGPGVRRLGRQQRPPAQQLIGVLEASGGLPLQGQPAQLIRLVRPRPAHRP